MAALASCKGKGPLMIKCMPSAKYICSTMNAKYQCKGYIMLCILHSAALNSINNTAWVETEIHQA